MTSGRKLTQEQIDRILELVALEDCDGEFRLTLKDISNQMELSRHTIYSVVRSAAAKWGRHTRWKSNQNMY
jgi:predicted DNA-binding protein (UPF0251 family)